MVFLERRSALGLTVLDSGRRCVEAWALGCCAIKLHIGPVKAPTDFAVPAFARAKRRRATPMGQDGPSKVIPTAQVQSRLHRRAMALLRFLFRILCLCSPDTTFTLKSTSPLGVRVLGVSSLTSNGRHEGSKMEVRYPIKVVLAKPVAAEGALPPSFNKLANHPQLNIGSRSSPNDAMDGDQVS